MILRVYHYHLYDLYNNLMSSEISHFGILEVYSALCLLYASRLFS